MEKCAFNQEEMVRVLDHVIDLFMKYQYERGYEEPRARAEAIRDVMEGLARSGGGRG